MGLFDCLVAVLVVAAGELSLSMVVVSSVVGESRCVAKTLDTAVVRDTGDCG